MTGLSFNFIKRAFIVPIIVTVIVIAMTFIAAPRMAASTQITESSTSKIDLSGYSLVEYDRFKDLEPGAYIGSFSCDAIGINAAITYSEDISKSSILLSDKSIEPWNNGCVILKGSNTSAQFKNLHKAEIGDEVNVDFYSNNSYTYKIADITYGNTEDDISSFKQSNTLIMCLPYNNFDDLGNSYYYAVYFAEKV
ncbi:MAG: sortase domain-bontaining protein [Eubacterium sp.]